MFKVYLIQSPKHGLVGRVYVKECAGVKHCVVVWTTGEMMHFKGPASILFRLPNRRELIPQFDGNDMGKGPCVKAAMMNYVPSSVLAFWNSCPDVPFLHKGITAAIV